MHRKSSFVNGYVSGCESTLNQILRILSQDDSINLNAEDKDSLISSILESSMQDTKENVDPKPDKSQPFSHVKRLQQTEINMGWNMTDDEEDSPLLSLRRESRDELIDSGKTYSTFGDKSINRIKSKNPPRDNYNMVYIVFFLMGMSTMLPWNFFTALTVFWNYKFRNIPNLPHDGPMDGHCEKPVTSQTDLQKEFTSYLSIASNIPNAIFVMINATYGAQFSSQKRITYSNLCIIILFVIISSLAATNSDTWQGTFLLLILTLVVLISSCASVFTGSIFGLAGKFPPKYMGSAMLGQAVGGMFPAIAVIIILALNIPAEDVGFTCFLIATGFLILGMVSFKYANRSKFFRYFSHSSIRKTSKTRKISEIEDVEGYMEIGKSKPPPSLDLLPLLKRAKTYSLAIFFTAAFTLSVFPSLTVLVEHYPNPESSSTKWDTLYFTPVSNFLLCSIGDTLGRILANNFQLSKKPERREIMALILSLLRGLFIPIFLFCNASPYTRTLPVVFDSDGLFICFMSILSLGNGYLGNICMLHGPKIEKLNGDVQEKIAMILVAFLVLGQAFGSFMSYFILKLL